MFWLIVFIVLIIAFWRLDCDLSLYFSEKFGKSLENLTGKVIWIVGSSSGIGEYLAYELAGQNCKLILSARREDELKRVKDECLKRGKISDADVHILPLDVTDMACHQAAVDAAVKQFGQIDVLVTNAGQYQRAECEEIKVELDRELFEVNVFGLLSLTRCLLPSFMSRNAGHIVVMSSLGGKMGIPNSTTYAATKHALHGYMESLRFEKSEYNIDVTIVCPGPFVSDFIKKYFIDKPDEITRDLSAYGFVMSVERCAYLTTVAIANKVEEAWICKNPFLLFTYWLQYLPTVSKKFYKAFGRNSYNKILMKKIKVSKKCK